MGYRVEESIKELDDNIVDQFKLELFGVGSESGRFGKKFEESRALATKQKLSNRQFFAGRFAIPKTGLET